MTLQLVLGVLAFLIPLIAGLALYWILGRRFTLTLFQRALVLATILFVVSLISGILLSLNFRDGSTMLLWPLIVLVIPMISVGNWMWESRSIKKLRHIYDLWLKAVEHHHERDMAYFRPQLEAHLLLWRGVAELQDISAALQKHGS